MLSVEIHAPSTNRRDHVEKCNKSTPRAPFSALSTNTPSKVQQTRSKPVKSVLQQTYPAPLPQSAPILVEKEVKEEEEQSRSENKEETLSLLEEFDEEQEELWTLKRANPIGEDDE